MEVIWLDLRMVRRQSDDISTLKQQLRSVGSTFSFLN